MRFESLSGLNRQPVDPGQYPMVYLPAMIESPVKTESAAATPPPDLAKKAVELTQQLLEKSRRLETASETRSNQKLAGLMNDEPGKELTFCLTDQVFRPSEASRSAELFRSLVDRFGIPEHLSPVDRLLMKVGAVASRFAPSIVMPAITRRLRAESRDVILPADPEPALFRNWLNTVVRQWPMSKSRRH